MLSPTIFASAATGALVSSLVAIFGQMLERKARRRELLLTKAIELAQAKTKVAREVAQESGQNLKLQDDILSAEIYHHWLTHLLDTVKLPADADVARLWPRHPMP